MDFTCTNLFCQTIVQEIILHALHQYFDIPAISYSLGQPWAPSHLLLSSWGLREETAWEPVRLQAMLSAKSHITWGVPLPQTFNHIGPKHGAGTPADHNLQQICSATLGGADEGSDSQLYPKLPKICVNHYLYTSVTNAKTMLLSLTPDLFRQHNLVPASVFWASLAAHT